MSGQHRRSSGRRVWKVQRWVKIHRSSLKPFRKARAQRMRVTQTIQNTPIVLEQVRTGATEHEGTIYGGEYSSTPMIVGYTTHNSNCTIRFYEPYYTISYKELSEKNRKACRIVIMCRGKNRTDFKNTGSCRVSSDWLERYGFCG